jgi:hypothetical protein
LRGQRSSGDSVENAMRVRLGRSLHGLWRKAVRTPLKAVRARLRSAAAARSTLGAPVSVDRETELAVVPFEGRFPPPLSQCVVVEGSAYEQRLHPLSVNSSTPEAGAYLPHEVRAPPMTLEHLLDQYWFPKLGLMISEKGRIWRHSFLGPFQPGFLTSVDAIVERLGADGSSEALFFPERLSRVSRIEGEHLIVANSEKPNYGHYLLDMVPLIHLGAAMGVPMLTWSLRPWQRALIARLDPPEGLIREIRPRPVFLRRAIVSNRMSGIATQNAHPQTREAFAAILANVRKAQPTRETPRRVLVCRSVANIRNIVNRAEMIEALRPLGFAAIQPETLSFDEQALTFAGADIIVCEFGAAATNVVFCREGAKFVEIIAEGQYDPWSAHLAAMLGLEHVVLFQRQTAEALANAPRHKKDTAFAYSVDVKTLVETVRRLIV